MPSPNANPTPITPPRVPLVDPRTGFIDRAWYLFFLSLNNAALEVDDNPAAGPDAVSLTASYDAALQELTKNVETIPKSNDFNAEIVKQIEFNQLENFCSDLLSQVQELQKQIDNLQSQPNASINNFYGPVAYVENFVGTEYQTVFILNRIPIGTNSIQIYVNGVYQDKNTYTLVGTTLTFSQAPPYTASIEVLYV
jgi:hypothetical protein